MNDDDMEEVDVGTGTHVEDSREPASLDDDSDENLVDKVKDVFTDDHDEVNGDHKAM